MNFKQYRLFLISGNAVYYSLCLLALLLEYFTGFAITFLALIFLTFIAFGIGETLSKDNAWTASAAGLAFLFGIILISGDTSSKIVAWIQSRSINYHLTVKESWMYKQNIFLFSDGIIDVNLKGSSFKSGTNFPRTGGGPTHWKSEVTVAPLVYEGWTKAEPVPVWVVCHDSWDENTTSTIDQCIKEWIKPHRSGYVVGPTNKHEISEAIKKAQEQHNLLTRSISPVIYWTADIKNKIPSEASMALGLIIFVSAIWNLCLLKKFIFSKNHP